MNATEIVRPAAVEPGELQVRKRDRFRADLRHDLGEMLRLLHDGAITA